MEFRPRFMATHLASVPHRDPQQVCRLILDNFPEAPTLPRLTKSTRMFLEGMPCLVVDAERRKLSFDLSPQREEELLQFYERVLADDVNYFAISEEWALGTYALLRELQKEPPPELKVVHIQTPGPISWALSTSDEKGAPAFYNETMRDIMVKTLAMKAKWQEKMVRQALPEVETLVDYGEPALIVHTSAVGSGAREDLIKAVNEVLGAVEGMAGIHCCANIDWSILMDSNADFINFDAFEYADKVALYAEDVKRFLGRGGMLAWGVVPTFDDKIAAESVDSLVERLEQGMQLMIDRGIDRDMLAEASWVTPSCSTASMSLEMAERAFVYASEVSRRMREKYFG